jgi:hypothetical protein
MTYEELKYRQAWTLSGVNLFVQTWRLRQKYFADLRTKAIRLVMSIKKRFSKQRSGKITEV